MPLKLVKRHGSPNFYIRGTVRGQPMDESTGTDNRQAAEAIKARTESTLLDRSIFGARATVTFLEAAVSFMENGGEARYVPRLLNHFAKAKLNSIGQADIDAAAMALYPLAKPSTRDRQVYAPMSAILRHGSKRKWCDFIILERPKFDNARVRWLTHEEADRLLANAAPHLRPLLVFMFATGARMGEALYLQWSDIDWKRKQVNFIDTKNGESRGVPLSDKAITALETISHQIGHVFLSNHGKPYRSNDEGGGQIKTGFKAACRRAGITDFHPHDCRHTWATWHYAANKDLASLQKLGGWKSYEMVLRYAHVNVENLRETINAIGW